MQVSINKTGTLTQNITTIESKFQGVRLHNKGLSFALLPSECIQNVKMPFKCRRGAGCFRP